LTSGRLRRSAALVPVLMAALGCGGDTVTGVNVNTTVRVVLDDNPSRSTPPVSGVQAPPAPGPYTGGLVSTARVAISADGETWHDVTGTLAVTVPLQNGDSAHVSNVVSVPAATYSRVRLTLRGASLTLSGATPAGTVTNRTLDVTDADVVLIREIPAITLSASTSARIAFDLNTEGWLTTAGVSSNTVSPSLVKDAVRAVAGYEDSSG
jgi:hypothetical protein